MCAERPLPTASAGRQRGVSLVEVMVAMVIALVISLAAGGSAAMFGASQKQGVGAGGATVNAGTALAAVKGDVASAGLGFFGDSNFQCHAMNLSVGSTVHLNGASFSPVRVTTGATGSDQLDVVFASNVDSGANVLIKGTSNGASVKLMSLLPVAVGDAVLLSPATPGAACLVRSVTAVAAATDESPLTLTFANTGAHNGATFTTSPSFAEKDRVALMGSLQWSRYSVTGTDLQLTRPLATGTGANSAVLVRNVMAFRAQYGITGTAAADTTLTGWQDAVDDTSGASGANWTAVSGSNVNRVRALRIGLVTRSAQREKADANSGTCVASTSKPVLFGATVEPDVTDWRCYRYRTAVVVVPLRNVAW